MVNPVIQAPQDPIKNAGLKYINGMQISNSTTSANTAINVAVGQCRDYTNTNDIVINAVYNTTVVPPALVSNYVVADTGVKGVGGIDVGTVAANTLYAVYAIGSSANPAYLVNYAPINQVPPIEYPYSAYPGAVILSTNFTAPTLPAGYDMFRRIGAIAVDTNSHIVPFTQVAMDDQTRYINYGTAVTGVTNAGLFNTVSAGHATGFTAVDLNVNPNFTAPNVAGYSPSVPLTATNVILAVSFAPTAAGNSVSFQPAGAAAGFIAAQASGSVAGVASLATVTCPCSIIADVNPALPSHAKISYLVSNGADSASWGVLGYYDLL